MLRTSVLLSTFEFLLTMKITLVGTGNVGNVLSRLFTAAGHTIAEVWGRNLNASKSISAVTNAEIKKDLSELSDETDVCMIAVSDAAIAEVTTQLNFEKALVVHTSGATSKEVLNRFKNYGVLYPLQSLRKEMVSLPLIPFFIDANTENNSTLLQQFVSSTGNTATLAGDEDRLKLHLAAVLSSNFTNHLYALTEAYCAEEGIDFKNLLPLIEETAARLRFFPAAQLQTGPAIRHDEITLQRHKNLLQRYPHLSDIYELLSQSIQTFGRQT